uniref:Protein U13 n=1 Tax=Human betaherpesvirus 6A TaxID=32603 RepID=A0A219XZK9_9BETA|nr:protein U13 [Human betaherpesvirus 6A]
MAHAKKRVRRKLLTSTDDPILSNTFTMRPTSKIADAEIISREHDYIASKTRTDSKKISPLSVILDKTVFFEFYGIRDNNEKAIVYPIDPDFLLCDSENNCTLSPFL